MNNFQLGLSIIGGILLIQVQLIGMVKWLVKHYLSELVPNSGSSMKDQMNRLEERQQEIFLHILRNDRS